MDLPIGVPMTEAEQYEITINVDSDKLELIRAAAAMRELSVEDFILDAALKKAFKTLLTDKVAFLSPEAYQAVCETALRLGGNRQQVRLE
ncbi:MAG: hypothetical protein ACJARL_000376 [Halopseudomonas sp.]|jgi:uncharacterized protein (DUF1778 family)